MSKFDKSTLKIIRNNLYNDFLCDIGAVPIKHEKMKPALHNILSKIDFLRVVSGNKIDADLLLRDLIANHIFAIVLKQTPYAAGSIMKLSMYFSPEETEKRRIQAEEARRKHVQKPSEPPSKRTEAMIFMSLNVGYSEDELVKRYRKMCLTLHPDKGGTTEQFLELQNAFEMLR
jgi:hypothetical protein